MKRIVPLFFILITFLLCACGKQTNSRVIDNQTIPDRNERQIITIATYAGSAPGLNPTLVSAIGRYNQISTQYKIVLSDYSEDGSVNYEDALRKLNIEIISGKAPDMICFSAISPFPFIRKNMLLDMQPLLGTDSLQKEDLLCWKALNSLGGLYILSDSFCFETVVGDQAEFGNRYGWTMEEYLNLQTEFSDRQIIYNTSRRNMFGHLYKRYLDTAIDWKVGKCDFDNAFFVQMLISSGSVRDYQETLNNELVGVGTDLIRKGKLKTSATYVSDIYTLAWLEKIGGFTLSYIGWPTVDGSCGTDIILNTPIGILSSSQNIDVCWQFLEFFITNIDRSYGMPLYKGALIEEFEDAMQSEDQSRKLNEHDKQNYFNLFNAVENIAMYDQTAMQIIEAEAEEYFTGQKPAEEVAKTIQSKMSIYLSEIQG